jgi:hypothetical protein
MRVNHDHIILQERSVSIIKQLAFSDRISPHPTHNEAKNWGPSCEDYIGDERLQLQHFEGHWTRYTPRVHVTLLTEMIMSLGTKRFL